MENLAKIQCDLIPSNPGAELGLEIWFDADKIFDSVITDSRHFEYRIDDDIDSEHELKFVLKNKTDQHTIIDDAGNIVNDSVRGASLYLTTNTTNAELTDANYLTAFNSNGFSLGSTNFTNGYTMVGWQWQAGQGTTSSNTSGSITSTVSVNTTAGFSIVTYTGVGGAAQTVGHGLGAAPKFIILMPRSFVSDKYVYHTSIGAANNMAINLTAASAATTLWNSTSPTSSVFTVYGGGGNTNAATYVAYCFAEIAGFSKFGSYTGNASSDGPFVYCGFRPKFVMIKRTDAIENWYIHDTSISPYNVASARLVPNQSAAEVSDQNMDIISNGFKFRTTDGAINSSGGTYIYAAFAETPFKYARAR